MKKGFTLVELIIVITIILVISSFAVGGITRIAQSMRFGNTFNKIVLMVQSARNMAITEKNSAVKNYSIEFDSNQNPHSVTIKGDAEEIEKLTLDASTNLNLTNQDWIGIGCNKAIISFSTGAAKTTLTCEGAANPNPSMLSIGIQESLEEGAVGRTKTFSIHAASGIPQVN